MCVCVLVCVCVLHTHTHTHMYTHVPITGGLFALAMGTWSYDESSDDRYIHTHTHTQIYLVEFIFIL